jgi:hypothetical protein
MTEDEVSEYINQIAFSGATDFIEKYKDKANEDQIIGHFGLGFYSAFMIADQVEINTLSYKEGAKAVHWTCDGGTDYEMEDGNRTEIGTEIILHVSSDCEKYCNKYEAEDVLHKYCSFMPYEIFISKDGEELTETIKVSEKLDTDVVLEEIPGEYPKDKDGKDRYDLILAFVQYRQDQGGGQGYTFGRPTNIITYSDVDMLPTVVHEIAHCYQVGDEYDGGSFNNAVNYPPNNYGGRDFSNGNAITATSGANDYWKAPKEYKAVTNSDKKDKIDENGGVIPEELAERYIRESRKVIQITNTLGFNLRTYILFLLLLFGKEIFWFLFVCVVLEGLKYAMMARYEAMTGRILTEFFPEGAKRSGWRKGGAGR